MRVKHFKCVSFPNYGVGGGSLEEWVEADRIQSFLVEAIKDGRTVDVKDYEEELNNEPVM